ncbi:cyclic nucleotide-binding domain protein, partial [Vibrio parahaemolyticus V-223/04]
AAALSND